MLRFTHWCEIEDGFDLIEIIHLLYFLTNNLSYFSTDGRCHQFLIVNVHFPTNNVKKTTIGVLANHLNRKIKRNRWKKIIHFGDFNEFPEVLKNEICEYGINIHTYNIDTSQGTSHTKKARTNRCINYVIRLLVQIMYIVCSTNWPHFSHKNNAN